MSKGSKQGFDKWLHTGTGQKCQVGFLANQPDEYKKNCLWWAYNAGAASGEISLTKEISDILEELKAKRLITPYLRRKIEYVLQHKEDYTIELMKTSIESILNESKEEAGMKRSRE